MILTSYAYVEFAEPEHIDTALTMDNSLFRGRLIKVSSGQNLCLYPMLNEWCFQVTAKRTNVPGFNRGRGGRGGYRGGYRGGFRGGFVGYSPYRGARGR